MTPTKTAANQNLRSDVAWCGFDVQRPHGGDCGNDEDRRRGELVGGHRQRVGLVPHSPGDDRVGSSAEHAGQNEQVAESGARERSGAFEGHDAGQCEDNRHGDAASDAFPQEDGRQQDDEHRLQSGQQRAVGGAGPGQAEQVAGVGERWLEEAEQHRAPPRRRLGGGRAGSR